MSKHLTILCRFLAAFLPLVVTACQPNGQSGAPPVAPPVVVNGTSDGAGGNGTAGKVFERYAVNPVELESFVQILSPIFNHINAQSTFKDFHFEALMQKLRTWYIAPVELKTLDNETIGFSISRKNSEQLAIQTTRAVWIDSEKFKGMEVVDQAYLIMHEFVMSLYFLKFLGSEEIACKYGDVSAYDCARGKAIFQALDKMNPPEPIRKLNSADYDNVREVTIWLLQNGSTATLSEFDKVLSKNQFVNLTFLAPKRASPKSTYQGSLFDLLNANILTGRPFLNCHFYNANISTVCRVKYTRLTNASAQSNAFVFRVDVELSNGKILSYDIKDEEKKSWLKYQRFSGPKFDEISAIDSTSFLEEIAVGVRGVQSNLLFVRRGNDANSDKSQLPNGLVLTPVAITLARTEAHIVGEIYDYYRMGSAQPEDDILILTGSKADQEVIENLYRMFKPEEKQGWISR